jgi:hypothetical protein
MGVALTAASLFLFVADQNDKEASAQSKLAHDNKKSGLQTASDTLNARVRTVRKRAANLFISSYFFIVGFFYALAGLIVYIGLNRLLEHKAPDSISLAGFLFSLPPDSGMGTTLSWGLLGGTAFATTDGAVRAMRCITEMLPKKQ